MTELNQAMQKAGRSYSRLARSNDLEWPQEKAFMLGLIERDEKLGQCTPESLANVILEAGTMGLSLNPSLHHCYVIPRKARRKEQRESWEQYRRTVPSIAYPSPSYRGLIHLAVTSGRIQYVAAEIVYKADAFRYFGPMKAPLHEGVINSQDRGYSNAVGVYALAKLAEGDFRTEYMDAETVERIRALSEQPNGLMWSPDGMWTEGWKKAVIRRMWKTMPMSGQMAQALATLDQHEGIVIEGETVQEATRPTISAEDKTTLRGAIEQKDGVDVDAWLQRLATRFGVSSIDELPSSDLKPALAILELAQKSIQGPSNAE